MKTFLHQAMLVGFLSLSYSFAAGCGSDAAQAPDDDLVDNGFESDLPNEGGSGVGSGAAWSLPGMSARASGESESENGATAVEQSDTVKIDGDHLYTLSRLGRFSVLAIDDPDHPRVQAQKALWGEPSGMFVKRGAAHVLIDARPNGLHQAQIVTLKLTDAAVPITHRFIVPGEVSSSALVGDFLYLVTRISAGENPSDGRSIVRIASLSLSADGVTPVGQVDLPAETQWAKIGAKRIYATIAVPRPESAAKVDETLLQAIDISGADGQLIKAGEVRVEGHILQVDEDRSALRLVGSHVGGVPSKVKVSTFQLDVGSKLITQIGAAELTLPESSDLRGALFDGARAYIFGSGLEDMPAGARQRDFLVGVDLSAPQAPQPQGVLRLSSMPLHVESRGSRLFTFGQEYGREAKHVVSVHDVSSLATPNTLSSVSFKEGDVLLAKNESPQLVAARGIHFDETAKTIAMVVSGGASSSAVDRSTGSTGGVQLLDFADDKLVLRGRTPSGFHRALSSNSKSRLFAVGERGVAAFDIEQRDQPRTLTELTLARRVLGAQGGRAIVEIGNHVATIMADQNGPSFVLTARDDVSDVKIIGQVSLSTLVQQGIDDAFSESLWTRAELSSNGPSHVFAVVERHPMARNGSDPNRHSEVDVVTFDVSVPDHPTVVGSVVAIPLLGAGSMPWTSVTQVGARLMILETSFERSTPPQGEARRRLHAVDLSTPSAPRVTPPLVLGRSLGSSGLVTTPDDASQTTLLTTRWLPSKKTPGKVQYYIDRIVLAPNDQHPVLLPSINVPGLLVAHDVESGRLLTRDEHVVIVADPGGGGGGGAAGGGAAASGRPPVMERVSELVLSDMKDTTVRKRQVVHLPTATPVTRGSSTSFGLKLHPVENRVYVESGRALHAFGGVRDGDLRNLSSWSQARVLAARGTLVAFADDLRLTIFDTGVSPAKQVAELTPMEGTSALSVILGTDRAFVGRGEYGFESVLYR